MSLTDLTPLDLLVGLMLFLFTCIVLINGWHALVRRRNQKHAEKARHWTAVEIPDDRRP